ncbi:MAG: DUF4340 domain-containing protein [Verrucomicrobia bacterium]|nr:DUF4340 domain-containing protein [Verrucomicrobiota bacterium]
MRTKVTLALVFLNVALFFFIFKFERQWAVDVTARNANSRVLGPEAADIRSLELTSTAPGGSFSLARRGEAWWLTKPLEWPANPHAVNSILHELQLLENVSSFVVKDLANNNMSLADYGLDHPKLTIAFASGDAAPTTLRIGDVTNIGNRLYILSPDGARIHVVARGLADSLSLGLDKLRADSVFTIQPFEARGLLVEARVLPAQSFSPAVPPATLPSADPKLRVTHEGNNRRETLFLGDPVPLAAAAAPASSGSAAVEYYAQLEGRPAVFTVAVPTALVEVLRNAQVSLRERRLLEFDPRNVTAVSLTAPNQPPLVLQRIDAGATAAEATWQIVRRGDAGSAPQPLAADRAAVQRLLEQLTLLSAKETDGFVRDAPTNADLENWGFNRPERELTLTLATPAAAAPGAAPSTALTTTTTTVQLGTDAQGALYARLDPLTNPKGYIYAVEFDYRRTALAAEPPARRDALEKLLAQLRAPRAKRFVQDTFTERVTVAGDDRPWSYRLDATVSLPGADQPKTRSLLFTERVGGAQLLAGSREFDAVFEIEQPLLDALWLFVYGPRDPGVPAEPKK